MFTSSNGPEECSQQQEVIVWFLGCAGKLHGTIYYLMKMGLKGNITTSIKWKLKKPYQIMLQKQFDFPLSTVCWKVLLCRNTYLIDFFGDLFAVTLQIQRRQAYRNKGALMSTGQPDFAWKIQRQRKIMMLWKPLMPTHSVLAYPRFFVL